EQDRQPGDVADGLEEQQDRPGELVRAAVQPDEDAERDRDRHARRRTYREAAKAVGEIIAENALVGELPRLLDDIERTWKEDLREQLEPDDECPDRDERDEGNESGQGRPAL